MFTVNRNPSRRDLLTFAWVMLLGFNALPFVLLTLLWLRSEGPRAFFTASGVLWILMVSWSVFGTIAGVISLASPKAAKRLYIRWMSMTMPIGMVMSTIMLTVLFVILLPIFSLIVRMGDPLRKKLGGATYWEDYKHYEPTLERMGRPF